MSQGLRERSSKQTSVEKCAPVAFAFMLLTSLVSMVTVTDACIFLKS
jgi:hypothetical protein